MTCRGLRPHTHAEREAIIAQLVPLFQEKFGDNLLAIASCASYARGQDIAYSDLELDVFLKEPLAEEEDHALQRVVDGMLIEVVYLTPEQYLRTFEASNQDWYLAASDTLAPVYNAAWIADLQARVKAIHLTQQEYLRMAAALRYELQESFGKVLNAIEQDNVEGISLLLFDAVMYLLRTLSPLNQQPFTTFARFIREARAFKIKPQGLDELLDRLVQGTYRDLTALRPLMMMVFEGVEQLFAMRGVLLFDEPLNPRLPNRKILAEPVERNLTRYCRR